MYRLDMDKSFVPFEEPVPQPAKKKKGNNYCNCHVLRLTFAANLPSKKAKGVHIKNDYCTVCVYLIYVLYVQ